jgi:glycosyltransferase involved in cell wall biosynthesis
VKLVVVSHPCVEPVNQDLYARVQALTGWDVTIVLPRRWKTEYGRRSAERWPAFHGDLVPLRAVPQGNIPLHVYLAAMRRRLRELRPDVVYVHNEPYAAATFQVVRAALSLDGVAIGVYSAQNLAKRYPWPLSRWERSVYAHADFALPVTAEVAGVLRGKGYEGHIEVMPLPVDTERFRPAAAGQASTRPFTAGYVGRLAQEKGVDTLLEALPLMDDAEARLLIAGDGPERNSLVAAAQRNGLENRITWAGYVPHDAVAETYRAMDVLVVPSRTVPSWKEQFGRVVVEALACGVPVIASDSGELPNLVEQTGGGWLFREGDSADLARVIGAVRTESARAASVAGRGRESVAKMFSADGVARKFVAVCERVRA